MKKEKNDALAQYGVWTAGASLADVVLSPSDRTVLSALLPRPASTARHSVEGGACGPLGSESPGSTASASMAWGWCPQAILTFLF